MAVGRTMWRGAESDMLRAWSLRIYSVMVVQNNNKQFSYLSMGFWELFTGVYCLHLVAIVRALWITCRHEETVFYEVMMSILLNATSKNK